MRNCLDVHFGLWQGWSCGLVHCPAGNATDLIRRVLASSSGISSWTPLKPQHSIPCWLSVQREPSACRSCQCCQKRDNQKFVGGLALSGLLGSGRSSMLPLGTRSLGYSSRSSFHHRSPEHQELWDLNWSAPPSPCCHDNVFLRTLGINFVQIFSNFSSLRIIVWTVPTLTSNCALIVSVDAWRSLSMKFFIWPINSGVLTSLLLPQLSSSLADSLPSLNLLCHSETDAQFMQDAPKAVWSIPYISVAFFPSLKQNFIAYCSFSVLTSRLNFWNLPAVAIRL